MGCLYLAIDINEDCGRHILGCLDEGRLRLEEVYRFEIAHELKDGKRLWDLQDIFKHIKAGIALCRELGKLPVLVGLTACDGYFVLLDENDKPIDDMVFELDEALDGSLIKDYTGCLDRAGCFLTLADYCNFLLTGTKCCEYTGLLGAGLISRDTKELDEEVIKKLGIGKEHFPPVLRPGNVIGNLTLQVTDELGYDFVMIQPASRSACASLAKLPASDISAGEEEPGKDSNCELAAAAGCLCILMVTSHELRDYDAARECIRNSFAKA